jgi:hypothetical protein
MSRLQQLGVQLKRRRMHCSLDDEKCASQEVAPSLMEKKMLKALTALVMLCATQVSAQIVSLQGEADCGMWLDARKAKSSTALEHFATGLVNGMSVGRGVEVWRVRGVETTPAQLYYWIDAHCARKPLNDVYAAVFEFVDERTGGEWKRSFKK